MVGLAHDGSIRFAMQQATLGWYSGFQVQNGFSQTCARSPGSSLNATNWVAGLRREVELLSLTSSSASAIGQRWSPSPSPSRLSRIAGLHPPGPAATSCRRAGSSPGCNRLWPSVSLLASARVLMR